MNSSVFDLIDFPLTGIDIPNTPQSRTVVRLTTSSWSDKRGIHLKRSVQFLRKQCIGHNPLEEESSEIGAESVINRIVNLDTCEDGVYSVILCNIGRDWETGVVDDYDFQLVSLK